MASTTCQGKGRTQQRGCTRSRCCSSQPDTAWNWRCPPGSTGRWADKSCIDQWWRSRTCRVDKATQRRWTQTLGDRNSQPGLRMRLCTSSRPWRRSSQIARPDRAGTDKHHQMSMCLRGRGWQKGCLRGLRRDRKTQRCRGRCSSPLWSQRGHTAPHRRMHMRLVQLRRCRCLMGTALALTFQVWDSGTPPDTKCSRMNLKKTRRPGQTSLLGTASTWQQYTTGRRRRCIGVTRNPTATTRQASTEKDPTQQKSLLRRVATYLCWGAVQAAVTWHARPLALADCNGWE